MATPSRSALLTKLHKLLKKQYAPHPEPHRPVLQHLLYACCLENSSYAQADAAIAALHGGYFDLNEVRVTSLKELAESLQGLPDPEVAAGNLRRVLQSVFDQTYTYDLEALRKQNLGQALLWLKKLQGATPFVVAYVAQQALGGHAIPLDRGALGVFAILGLSADADGTIAGLERAIPKSRGVEFSSLLHQLAADLIAKPKAPHVLKLLMEISAEAKDRFKTYLDGKLLPKEPKADPALRAAEVQRTPAEAQKHAQKASSEAGKAAAAAQGKSGDRDDAKKPKDAGSKTAPPAKSPAAGKPGPTPPGKAKPAPAAIAKKPPTPGKPAAPAKQPPKKPAPPTVKKPVEHRLSKKKPR